MTASPGETLAAQDLSAAGYPRTIWLLLGGSFLVRALGFAYPFLGFYVAARGHGAGAAGVVLAAFGVGWVVGLPVSGWLVDRVGRRSTLATTMLVAAMVLTLLAGAHGVPALVVGAVLAGSVYDAPRAVLSTAIADLVPDPERRAKVDAWRYGFVMNAGTAIAAAVGGVMADRVGISVLYLLNAFACAVFSVIALTCVPHGVHHPAASANSPTRQLLSDRRLVLLFASSVATLTAYMGLLAVMPMLMAACGLQASAYGWALSANTLAVVATTPLITPWLSGRVAARPRLDILATAAVWTTVCIGAAGFARTTVDFCVAAALCAPGEIAWFAVAAGVVHQIAPTGLRGRYHGVWGTALAIAAVIAPIVGAYCLRHGGHALVALTTLAVGMVGAALCLPLARVMPASG